ncbi:MAG: nucleoside deaminase [Phycisphaerales bacterium]|nr:nucleoside deaminase [Phycisphaerales bacterium]
MSQANYIKWLDSAIEQAEKSWSEGGIPIGAVLVDQSGTIVARGHNLRVQSGDPTAHGEVVCIRNAGRRRDWEDLTLVTTLWPCTMCTGLGVFLRIPRIVVGETSTFSHAQTWMSMLETSTTWLKNAGVETIVLDDSRCIELMATLRREKPDLWNEDLGE